MGSRVALGLWVLVIAGAACVPATAAVESSPGPASQHVTGRGFSPAPRSLGRAVLRDTRQAAKTDGIPVKALIARQARGRQFAALANELEQEYPQSFTAAGLVRGSKDTPWVAFREAAPPGVLDRLEALPNDTVLVTRTNVSTEELQAAAALVVNRVQVLTDAASVVSSVDPWSFALTVEYVGGDFDHNRINALDDVMTAVARQVAPGIPDVDVKRGSGTPLSTQLKVQGGRRLIASNAICTAGFTAIRRGKRGLLTAKHCPRGMRYQGRRGVIKAGAGARNSPNGQIDLRFFRTKNRHRTIPQFRATSTRPRGDRTVRASGNPVVGQSICKWGSFSRYGCSVVAEVNLCASFADTVVRCGLGRTANSITTNGDSGGPWFQGTTARGITTGGDTTTSLFTQISKARSFLGARVLRK